jgi:hypothetical protein
MANHRLIDDKEAKPRTQPMRVLVLGMPRTGTSSLIIALRTLGYTPYHMRSILTNPAEIPLWHEAVNTTLVAPAQRPAAQRNLAPYTKADFDKLLGDCDTVADLPGCIFAQQLLEAYPEAKVILTTRAYDDWEASMQESLWCFLTWRLFAACRVLGLTQMAPLMRFLHAVFRVHNGNHYGGPAARDAYKTHYDTIRSLVPAERLLEVEAEKELGWERLCAFLGNGRTPPSMEYPKTVEDAAMRATLEKAWRGMVRYMAMMVVLPGLVVVLAVAFFFYYSELVALRDEWVLGPLKAYLDA